MDLRPITPGELAVGAALRCDVYGDGGALLARKGCRLASERQVEHLARRGRVVLQAAPVAPADEPPSVLRMLNSANRRLQLALAEIALGRGGGTRARLEDTARLVTAAVDLHPDVALACILHNQGAGPYAVRHSVDTAIVALLVARALKKSPAGVMTIILGALTMNLGMLEHQERLQRSRGPLSELDMKLIRTHPETGAALLRAAGIDDKGWLDCVLLHHESENGSGYPFGWHGAQIPEAAKLVALADRYCASVSARIYRKSLAPNAAMRDVLREGETTIDAALAAVFIREFGIYPIGTLVRLANGEIGVVTRKGRNTITPLVAALAGPRGAALPVIVWRDTGNERHAICEVLSEADAGLGFRLDHLWGRVASA
jgi:HD-GYP domain-containing protein (c-di-GMP phosphodiesterase class II)